MSPDTPPPPPPPAFNPALPSAGGAPKTSGAAVASLILGAMSLFCFCLSGLPGLICGFIGLSNIDKSGGKLKGKGLAIMGIVLSVLLPVACAAIGYATFGKGLLSAGKQMFQATTHGAEVAVALRKYVDAHDGMLPDDIRELGSEGLIDAAALASPIDGSDGFWSMVEGGSKLSDLPPSAAIATGGPISVKGEELTIVIQADGQVKPKSAREVDRGPR